MCARESYMRALAYLDPHIHLIHLLLGNSQHSQRLRGAVLVHPGIVLFREPSPVQEFLKTYTYSFLCVRAFNA